MAALHVTAVEGQHQGEVLEAQVNPQEIVVDRTVTWQRQAHKGAADLEFEQVDAARMSFQLVFDGTQASTSIQPQLDKLDHFGSIDAVLHRPPRLEVSWGSAAGAMPLFAAVLEAVSVRYTKFAPNGVPVQATADVRLKQAAHLAVHTA